MDTLSQSNLSSLAASFDSVISNIAKPSLSQVAAELKKAITGQAGFGNSTGHKRSVIIQLHMNADGTVSGTYQIVDGDADMYNAIFNALGFPTFGGGEVGSDANGGNLSPASPTSLSDDNPKSVSFTKDEGVWGEVHWSGEAAGVAQLQKDLKKLSTLKSTQPLIKALASSNRYLSIRANMNNEYSGKDFMVTVDVAHSINLMTEIGMRSAASIIKLAHEIAHAILGSKDDGPGKMNNVINWENPIRIELGYPIRTKY